jgi:hypothetical protein
MELLWLSLPPIAQAKCFAGTLAYAYRNFATQSLVRQFVRLREAGTPQNQNRAEPLRVEIKLNLSAVQSALAELVKLKKQLATA